MNPITHASNLQKMLLGLALVLLLGPLLVSVPVLAAPGWWVDSDWLSEHIDDD